MRKRIIILAAIVLFVVLAWSGAWFFAAGLVRQQVEALALADGDTAPQLQCTNLDIGGYPFRFDIDCSGASVVSGDMLLEIPGLRVSAMVYRPTHLVGSVLGPAALSDAFTGQRQEIAWKSLEASLRLDNWRIARLSVLGNEVTWSDRLFGDMLIASTPNLELHLLDIPEQHDAKTGRAALAGYFRAQALDAPGIELSGANAEVEVEVTALPDDIRNWGAVPFLPDWQQAGGQLRLVGIRANDGNADLDASGQLSLDAKGYPTGSIAIDSQGVAERIGPMIDEPWRTLVLGVPGEDGRHKNQLNFANGAVSSGLVPIAGLAPLF